MQEHTKKPAFSHNKAGNYRALFLGRFPSVRKMITFFAKQAERGINHIRVE